MIYFMPFLLTLFFNTFVKMIGRIYMLIDPRDHKPKYIGQTTVKLKDRLNGHIRQINGTKRNKKTNWIKKLLSINLKPSIEQIDELEFKNFEELDLLEIMWIGLFKSWGFNLKNGTEGGKSGRRINKYKLSLEQIEKQRLTLKEGYASGRLINKNKGKKMSEKQLVKLRKNSSFNGGVSKESLEKRIKSNTGKKRSDIQKENLSIGQIKSLIKKGTFKVIKCYNEIEYYEFKCLMDACKFIKLFHTSYLFSALRSKKEFCSYYWKYGSFEESNIFLKKNGFEEMKFESNEKIKRKLKTISMFNEKELKIFESLKQLNIETGIGKSGVVQCLKHISKTYKKYYFLEGKIIKEDIPFYIKKNKFN